VIVIQGTLLDAVHAQPLLIATETVAAPPSGPIGCDGAVIVGSHAGAGGAGAGVGVGAGVDGGVCAAACATAIDFPATRSVPFLGPPRLAATVAVTLPFPVPVEPAVTEIQSD
jgi:hypothetical protein